MERIRLPELAHVAEVNRLVDGQRGVRLGRPAAAGWPFRSVHRGCHARRGSFRHRDLLRLARLSTVNHQEHRSYRIPDVADGSLLVEIPTRISGGASPRSTRAIWLAKSLQASPVFPARWFRRSGTERPGVPSRGSTEGRAGQPPSCSTRTAFPAPGPRSQASEPGPVEPYSVPLPAKANAQRGARWWSASSRWSVPSTFTG